MGQNVEVRRQCVGRRSEPARDLARGQAIVAGLDEHAESGQPSFMSERREARDGVLWFHCSNLAELFARTTHLDAPNRSQCRASLLHKMLYSQKYRNMVSAHKPKGMRDAVEVPSAMPEQDHIIALHDAQALSLAEMGSALASLFASRGARDEHLAAIDRHTAEACAIAREVLLKARHDFATARDQSAVTDLFAALDDMIGEVERTIAQLRSPVRGVEHHAAVRLPFAAPSEWHWRTGPRTSTWPVAVTPLAPPSRRTSSSRASFPLADGQGWPTLQVSSISRAAMPARRMHGPSAHQIGPSPSHTRVGVQSEGSAG